MFQSDPLRCCICTGYTNATFEDCAIIRKSAKIRGWV